MQLPCGYVQDRWVSVRVDGAVCRVVRVCVCRPSTMTCVINGEMCKVDEALCRVDEAVWWWDEWDVAVCMVHVAVCRTKYCVRMAVCSYYSGTPRQIASVVFRNEVF